MRIVTTQEQLLFDILKELKQLREYIEANKQVKKAEEILPQTPKQPAKRKSNKGG